MDSHEYDEIIRQLVQIAAHQDTINDDLRAFNRQQVAINADTRTTLARIETLLARMLRHRGEREGRLSGMHNAQCSRESASGVTHTARGFPLQPCSVSVTVV